MLTALLDDDAERQEDMYEKVARLNAVAEEKYQPRDRGGICCIKSWKYFFGTNDLCLHLFHCTKSLKYSFGTACENGCDFEMGMFAVFFFASLILFCFVFNLDIENKPELPLIGLGVSLAMPIAFKVQITKILDLRVLLARSLDTNRKLQNGSKDLSENVQKAIGVRHKLQSTYMTTENARKQLAEKYRLIKKYASNNYYASDLNSKVASILNDKYIKLLDDLRDELIASEKAVIESIFDNLHLRDGVTGLDRDEFKKFLNALPSGYKERFKFELDDFEQYAGEDGIFDRQELFAFLDKYAEEEALMISGDPTTELVAGVGSMEETQHAITPRSPQAGHSTGLEP